MKRYTKEDVERHNTGGYGGPYLPAVNVKVYGPCHVDAVANKFGCSEPVAERALGWQFESAAECFWEQVEELAESVFGAGVKVWSAGRCNGWAVVEGLPALETWDAVQLAKWRRFEILCRKDVDYKTAEQAVLEDIEANRWAEASAEKWNYYEKAGGESVCLADANSKEVRGEK